MKYSDDCFLNDLGRVAHELIAQDKMGIDQLCSDMDMSRSQVHRKVKALTGSSTSIYIRKLKLEKARKLLVQSNLSIAEVASKSGIKNPQNMSKYFSHAYGVSPTQYRSQEKC